MSISSKKVCLKLDFHDYTVPFTLVFTSLLTRFNYWLNEVLTVSQLHS